MPNVHPWVGGVCLRYTRGYGRSMPGMCPWVWEEHAWYVPTWV